MTDTDIRPYEEGDADGLWELKVVFERGLGAAGSDEKEAAYDDKLTDAYRDKWLAWVARCTDDEDCIFVATADDDLVGYVFLLPERLAFVWDAAVVNELYLRPEYRGTGLADDLFARGLDHARAQDLPLDRVVLDVDRENERARAFYERHDFTHWGEMVARDL
ncbi:GNAT family N-acetyltransferase [Halorarius litoreus]|uniref:GNAT family N-acetyltransferase n=1 Tax=Halorarius litoreus TaxID=2962676 RepID=UPI0020CBF71A|nr:GNAT family N-acetyltransferase [Halorarius litoreus]